MFPKHSTDQTHPLTPPHMQGGCSKAGNGIERMALSFCKAILLGLHMLASARRVSRASWLSNRNCSMVLRFRTCVRACIHGFRVNRLLPCFRCSLCVASLTLLGHSVCMTCEGVCLSHLSMSYPRMVFWLCLSGDQRSRRRFTNM